MLVDHRTLGGLCAQAVVGNVQRGALLVELDPGQNTALDQSLGPGEVELRLVCLRLKGFDLRIERLHLENQLFVADGRDRLTGGNAIAFPDLELSHRAADSCARRHHADAFDRGEHGLFISDGLPRDDEGFRFGRCDWSCRQAARREGGQQAQASR